MITVEDKIRTFSKYVYEKEVKLSNEQLEEIQSKNQEILNEKKNEVMEKCSFVEEKKKNKINLDSQKIISLAKVEAKDKILNTRTNVLNTLMEEITASLIIFTDTLEYEEYLEALLLDAKDFIISGKMRISLLEKDIHKYKDDIKSINNDVEFLQLSHEQIGGIMVENPSTNERIDFTLKGKLEMMRNEIGIRLYEALEK